MELDIQGFLNSLPISKYQRKILDEIITPIEPCATSSEIEFKEKVMEIMKDNIHFAPQVDGFVVHGAIDKIWELHSASPTGDRDCEELKAELDLANLENQLSDDSIAEYKNTISVLESRISELGKGLEEMNNFIKKGSPLKNMMEKLLNKHP